ncbi:polysaccharide biosynthesis tyrosine autokinase [Geofilum rubicundum]|uniref:non-specific protein-tyrosine kinase n=1 Tax=Geofilum rubicundum JCM 15548 TaxID=1236989 RepID=A0A0E9LW72_9BACT|nr:polysaccharide biosynthesis tyrosine autokinase [Geofilum rubicundum]GAO29553.1 tyrosine-protein kinase EpsD [Geofilum rubicundum JCM 15548]
MDVSYQGQMILTQSQELEEQKSALLAKLDYYSYLNDYIESNRDMQEVIVPTSMGIEDPVLGQLISQLSTLNAERSALRFNATTENPNITRINASIDNLKSSIQESLSSVISATNLSLNDINNRLYNLSGQIRKLPGTEQRLLNIERSRQMNNETYTFLLTKLTEAQLAKAANRPDNEIVEEAISKGMVVPDQKRSVMLVLLLGLFLPAVVIFIKIFSNDKVLETDDVKEFSVLPIIGEVPHERKNGKVSLAKAANSYNGNTILAESFRSIRTSLGYYSNQKASKTVLFTSTLPGEGKSFCAINLAKSFAQLNKRTLLIEFDMRRPSLSKQSGITSNGNGLSAFYTGDAKVEDIINKDSELENLHIIFAGHIPPNPSELIAGEATKRLMEQLQEKYDMIIIDTPPVGIVADAHLLTEYADVNVMVVRHNVTPKPVLKMNLRDEKVKNIPHLSVLVNGIPFQRKEYSYKYGYDANSKYFAKN